MQQKMASAHPVLAHDGEKHVVLPASEAWPRLQSLHQHALLESSKGDLTVSSPKSAKSVYANSLGSALGQFATAHPALRDSMFHSLVDHVSSTGSMDGLESLYASGLQHTVQSGGALHDRAMRTMKAVGLPTVSGGGLRPMVLYPKQYRGATAPRDSSVTIPDPAKLRTKPIAQLGGHLVTGLGSGKPSGLPQAPGDLPSAGDLSDLLANSGFVTPGGGGGGGGDGQSIQQQILAGLGIVLPGGSDGTGGDQHPGGLGGYKGPVLGPVEGGGGLGEGGGTTVGGNTNGYGNDIGDFFRSGGPKGPGQNNFGNQHPGPGDVGDLTVDHRLISQGPALLQNVVDNSPAAGRGDPRNLANEFGPHGTGHIWTPQGGGGDPLEDDNPDKTTPAAPTTPAPTKDPTTATKVGLTAVALVTLAAEAIGEFVGGSIAAVGSEAKAAGMGSPGPTPNVATGKAEGGHAFGTAAYSAGMAFFHGLGLGHRPADDGTGGGGGSGPAGPKSFGELPSDQAGSPVSPKAYGYLPSEEGGSPIGPRARSSNEATPAPDDPRGGGGPRALLDRSPNDVLPDPESNGPGTPHS